MFYDLPDETLMTILKSNVNQIDYVCKLCNITDIEYFHVLRVEANKQCAYVNTSNALYWKHFCLIYPNRSSNIFYIANKELTRLFNLALSYVNSKIITHQWLTDNCEIPERKTFHQLCKSKYLLLIKKIKETYRTGINLIEGKVITDVDKILTEMGNYVYAIY